MLDFLQVTDPKLKAVKHVDGSARVQTIRHDQNAKLYDLLKEFKLISGVGVLCNTSLNFKGAGFINKTSDLYHFGRSAGLSFCLASFSASTCSILFLHALQSPGKFFLCNQSSSLQAAEVEQSPAQWERQ